MKKKYIHPEIDIVLIATNGVLAGSGGGPGAGDQSNPGMGGGGAREWQDFDLFDDEES